MINWYTLQSNYHAIIIFCSSHPRQIKPIKNYYLCNIREILRGAVGSFLTFQFPFPGTARPRVTSRRPPRDLQHRRCFKQSCDWDEVCGERPACASVTTSQLLLRDITPDNLPWIFIRRHCLAHTGLHTHIHRWSSYTTMFLWSKRAHYLPVVPQSSAEITNQSTLSELGSLSACLSTPFPLVGNTLTAAHLIPSPLTKCWFESLFSESPLIALMINEKACLIYL